jgi:hypothetical protein
LRVDADFEDGYNRQLRTIQAYCRHHPHWLKDRRVLTHPLSDYENVFFLLIVEGEDFHVQFDRGVVEGVGVESEVYYGGSLTRRGKL